MDEWIRACVALMAARVRFLIVGAFGAELHFLHDATQILTHDMDLLLPREPESFQRALEALRAAGFTLRAGDDELLPDAVVIAGILRQAATVTAVRGPETLDLMSQAAGVDFETLWRGRTEFTVRGVTLPVAELAAILRSKKEAGRMKDRLFLEQFREVIESALARDARRQGGRGPPSGE